MNRERLSKLAGIMSEDDLKTQHGEELLNKVAMWIYHESSEPISEIEYLLKKSDAVGEYIDAVEESKETDITEIEVNPGDEVVNHLNDIEESISTINHDNLSEMAMRIQDAVEEIRTKLDLLGWEQYD
jgi:hypothetical protein